MKSAETKGTEYETVKDRKNMGVVPSGGDSGQSASMLDEIL